MLQRLLNWLLSFVPPFSKAPATLSNNHTAWCNPTGVTNNIVTPHKIKRHA